MNEAVNVQNNVVWLDEERALRMFPHPPEPKPEPKSDAWDFAGDQDYQVAMNLLDTLVQEEKWEWSLWNLGFCTLKVLLARWMLDHRKNYLVDNPTSEQEFIWRKTRRTPSLLAWGIKQVLDIKGDQRAAQDLADALYLRHAFNVYTILDNMR